MAVNWIKILESALEAFISLPYEAKIIYADTYTYIVRNIS